MFACMCRVVMIVSPCGGWLVVRGWVCRWSCAGCARICSPPTRTGWADWGGGSALLREFGSVGLCHHVGRVPLGPVFVVDATVAGLVFAVRGGRPLQRTDQV